MEILKVLLKECKNFLMS